MNLLWPRLGVRLVRSRLELFDATGLATGLEALSADQGVPLGGRRVAVNHLVPMTRRALKQQWGSSSLLHLKGLVSLMRGLAAQPCLRGGQLLGPSWRQALAAAKARG